MLHLKSAYHCISGLRWGWTSLEGHVIAEGTAGRTFARKCLVPLAAEEWPKLMGESGGLIMVVGIWRDEEHGRFASFVPLVHSDNHEHRTLTSLSQLIVIPETQWLDWLNPKKDGRLIYDA